MRPEPHQALEHRNAQQVGRREDRVFQDRPEGLQLHPVLAHEALKPGDIIRRNGADLLGHTRHIGRGVENGRPALTFEDEAVLRVEADHIDLLLQLRAATGENFLQNPRIEKKGGAQVETIAFRGAHGAGASTHHAILLEDGDLHAGSGQLHRSRKPSWARANDGDLCPRAVRVGGGERCVHRIIMSLKPLGAVPHS